MMDFLSTQEYEQETIRRALAGDHEAGFEALKLCQSGLDSRTLSAPLAHYLAERLHDVLEGIKPDRALCIAKPPYKLANPFPDWEQPLGAIAALLFLRGYKPTQINNAMSDARQNHQSKDLDAKEALRIRKTYSLMQNLGVDDLTRMAGKYGEILKDYPHCK